MKVTSTLAGLKPDNRAIIRLDTDYNKGDFKMLVVSRYRDESIMIGNSVEITVTDVCGKKVQLGITAPKQIPIYRKEIYEARRLQGALNGKLTAVYS